MKEHTTNYKNAFITVAADCPAVHGVVPPNNGEAKTVANLQFELIRQNPYKFTSDEVLFQVYAIRKVLTSEELEAERVTFFSKGQPCFRASPLPKRYGWGVHHNQAGKMALVPLGSEEYEKFVNDKSLEVVSAMKNKR